MDTPPTTAAGAVFLSYAREDAAAARRIAEAMRGWGVEVWFDQSELRGGDAWDSRIKRQIRECALFLPLVSAQTQGRTEGYFRREWKLAAERTHDMAAGIPFLLPVVIDDTVESTAMVPEEFMHYHWTRLANGELAPDFGAQVKRLLAASKKPVLNPALPRPRTLPALQKKPAGPGWRWAAAGALLVAVGVGIMMVRQPEPLPTATKSSASSTSPQSADKSVAVLAFSNLSDDKANEYFSDGISEELLNVLARVPGLKVSARTSAFYFKGKNVPIPEIAQQLGVAYVVEGSVQRAGDRVKITAQLIKSADGFHVWSDTFTRDLKDIFAVQDEIAGLIAQQLQLKLGETTAVVIDPEAFQLYLEGRQLWFRRTADAMARMEVLFGRALKLEPRFAAAEAGLAQVWITRVFISAMSARQMTKEIDLAEKHGRRALELDPESAEAFEALGTVALFRNELEASESALQRAVRLNPNYVNGWTKLGWLRERQGRLDEALAYYRRARDLDPLVWIMSDAVGRSLIHIGQLDEADRVFTEQQALPVSPPMSWSNHAIALLLAGRTEEALAKARVVTGGRFVGKWDPSMVSLSTSLAAWVLAEGGARAEAEEIIKRQLAGPKQLHWAAVPALYALSRPEEAIAALPDTPQQMILFLWFLHARRPGLSTDPGFLRGLEQLGATEAFRAVNAHPGRRQVMAGNGR